MDDLCCGCKGGRGGGACRSTFFGAFEGLSIVHILWLCLEGKESLLGLLLFKGVEVECLMGLKAIERILEWRYLEVEVGDSWYGLEGGKVCRVVLGVMREEDGVEGLGRKWLECCWEYASTVCYI